MMKKVLAVLALAGMPGCCVAGATIGGSTGPKESQRSHAEVGFAVGLAIDVLTIVAISSMHNPGAALDGID